MRKHDDCPICIGSKENILWSDNVCRVIGVEQDGYPGYCRAIWHNHVAEMTDLEPRDQVHLMNVVFAVERELRMFLKPEKINLASFGNYVPHLHWHIIPRFVDDPHFPDAIWASQKRQAKMVEIDTDKLWKQIRDALS